MSYPYCYYGPTCQLELFFTMKCPKQAVLVCPIGNIGVSACPMVAFSGFHESHEPPPWGDECDSTAASRWPSKWPAKWVHVASSLCWLSPWWPPGWYGASNRPMATSSGFWCSPGHAASGDATTRRDAVLATIVAGGWDRFQIIIAVNINKLISTLIIWINQIASTLASERTCARPPTPQTAWVHQIHAAGGASGSTTMVMVFVRWFVLFVCFFTCDLSVGHILPKF